MGNNQHLKRHSAPVAWPIKRKNITFITKPNPGSHESKYVVPIVVLIRDVLKYAQTAKEVKLIVNNEEVLVNGKRIVDVKFAVGLFDILEIKKTNEKYITLFDVFGKIKLIKTNENNLYLKVANKTQLPNKQYQLNFMNGFNLLVSEKEFNGIKGQDTIVYDFEKKKISSVINFKEGNFIYIFDGKFKGQFAQIKGFEIYNGVTKDVVKIEVDGEVNSTAKEYCFVVGSKSEDLKKLN